MKKPRRVETMKPGKDRARWVLRSEDVDAYITAKRITLAEPDGMVVYLIRFWNGKKWGHMVVDEERFGVHSMGNGDKETVSWQRIETVSHSKGLGI